MIIVINFFVSVYDLKGVTCENGFTARFELSNANGQLDIFDINYDALISS
jgi:hypothetical protein